MIDKQHINEHLRRYENVLREQTAIAMHFFNENKEVRARLAELNEGLLAALRLLINLNRSKLRLRMKETSTVDFPDNDLLKNIFVQLVGIILITIAIENSLYLYGRIVFSNQ